MRIHMCTHIRSIVRAQAKTCNTIRFVNVATPQFNYFVQCARHLNERYSIKILYVCIVLCFASCYFTFAFLIRRVLWFLIYLVDFYTSRLSTICILQSSFALISLIRIFGFFHFQCEVKITCIKRILDNANKIKHFFSCLH